MKNFFLSLMTATLALAGCSKNDDNGGLSSEESNYPTKIVTRNGSGVLEGEDSYTIQGGKILSSLHTRYEDDGVTVKHLYSITVTYEGNRPKTSVQKTSVGDNESATTTYNYYEDGKLQSTSIKYEGSEEPEVTVYSYNGDFLIKKVSEAPYTREENGQTLKSTRVTETDYQRNGDRITATEKEYTKEADGTINEANARQTVIIYTLANENVIKKETITINSSSEYTYDDKNNFSLGDLSKRMNPEYLIIPEYSRNNVLTHTHSFNNSNVFKTVYEYSYNEKNYPTSKKEYRVTTTNGVESKELTGQKEYTY